MEYNITKDISFDVKAGITVFLVAIPLCLGIALASGVSPISGVISGIIGGIVVGFFSGSQLSVSGPAAGLVTVVLSAIAVLGSFDLFLMALVLAGIIQIVFGILKAGIIAHYIPYSVIKGMLAAIGVILIMKQIPHAVGFDKIFEGSEAFIQEDGSNTLSELFYLFDYLSAGAVIISIVSFLCLYVFDLESLKKYTFFRYMPGALVAIIVAAIMNQIFQWYFPDIALYQTHLVNIQNVDFDNLVGVLSFPSFEGLTNFQVYKFAFIIAIIGSIETLLCIEAADKLDPEKRITPTGKELKAQGMGNVLSGLIGGLPITSVIVRTSVNIENNAKSKLSTIIHGCLLILALFIGTSLINKIPLASLAVILIVTGYKLANEKLIRDMFKKGMSQFIPFMVTVLGVFFTDILIGVCCGLAVSIIFILRNYYNLQNFDLIADEKNKKYTYIFSSYTAFLSKAGIQKSLNALPGCSSVVLNFQKSKLVDAEIKEVIYDFIIQARSKSIEVEILENPNMSLNLTK